MKFTLMKSPEFFTLMMMMQLMKIELSLETMSMETCCKNHSHILTMSRFIDMWTLSLLLIVAVNKYKHNLQNGPDQTPAHLWANSITTRYLILENTNALQTMAQSKGMVPTLSQRISTHSATPKDTCFFYYRRFQITKVICWQFPLPMDLLRVTMEIAHQRKPLADGSYFVIGKTGLPIRFHWMI